MIQFHEVSCVTDVKPDEMLQLAMFYLALYEDWTQYNETQFTGWGEQTVPPGAEYMRVKAGQALCALKECNIVHRPELGVISKIEYGEDGEVALPYWSIGHG